jgi:hypothetical protein
MRTALALFLGFLLIFTGGRLLSADLASAMTVGVQDQGADPATLKRVADDLGATTVRMVVRTQDPQADTVARYRAMGLNVQVAIVVKRSTTPAQVLATVRAWHGMVRTVSVGNEPELNGVPACTYARLFSRARHIIGRMFPGIVVGFGEFSPVRAFEYIQQIGRCHERIRADFTAVHPYQFFSDPLTAPTERSGVGTWLGLGNLGRFRSELRQRLGLSARLRATEFNYLVDGRYKITMSKATSLWPRAIQQAKRHVDQLVLYGLGTVPAGTWGSSSLLDSNGRRTPAFLAVAKALGRTLRPEHEPPVEPSGLLPDGTTDHWPVVDIAPVTAPKKDDPPKGEGATVDPAPVVVPPDMPTEAPLVLAPVPDVPVEPVPVATTEVQ